MKKVFYVALGVCAMACVSTPAFSWWRSGNDILQDCEKNTGFIYGYIFATIDAQEYSGIPRKYCLPADLVGKQLRDAVCLHIDKSISTRQYIGPFLVEQALAEQWPCRQ